MTYEQFESSLRGEIPDGISVYLTALWKEKCGDWNGAHELLQDIEDVNASWIHAYLHRREGDESNARYWYGRAGKPFPAGQTLDQEWKTLVEALL